MNHLFRPIFTQSFRTTGVYLLIIALTLAISATTALKFSNEQIKHAVALQAAEMLAADLAEKVIVQFLSLFHHLSFLLVHQQR